MGSRYNLRQRGGGKKKVVEEEEVEHGSATAAATPPEPASGDEKDALIAQKVNGGGRKKSSFKRLLSVASPEMGRLSVAMISLLVSSGTNMAFPTIVGRVVDRTAGGYSSMSNKTFFSGALCLFACGSVASWSRTYNFGLAADRIARRLRNKVFKHLLMLDATFFDGRRSGELVGILTEDVDVAAKTCTEKVASGLRSLSSAVNGTIMLFTLSPRLTLLSLAMVPIIGAGAMAYSRRVKRLSKGVQERAASSTAFADERLAGIRTVRLSAREVVDADMYAAILDTVGDLNRRAASAQGLFMGGLSLTVNASLMAVLYAGGSLVAEGAMTVGNLTSFAIYSSMVGLGFSGLGAALGDISRGLGCAERLFDLLDTVPLVPLDKGQTLPTLGGKLSMKDVWFHYPQRKQDVLCGLNLEVESGEVLAVTGKSGAGKSTIFLLLSRMYDATEGAISLDGVDITQLSPVWLRRNIGVVDQEPTLFEGSIAENIRYTQPGATQEDIERAAKEANADDFIRKFPDGYDTLVGERGKQLSGGQKQRIAIARAFLKDAKMLLLDEATSALDSESERMVQGALDRLMKGRTTIIIAHRRSTVANAKRVAVVEGGRIVEQGSYESLMAIPDGVLAGLMQTNSLT